MDAQIYLRNVSTLSLDSTKCNGCSMCINVCPHNVFKLTQRKAEIIDSDRCMECSACVINCEQKALSVKKGVGCATAVIGSFIKGGEPSCDCDCGPSPSCN